MPVRSLHSSVMKWPDAEQIDRAISSWAQTIVEERNEILRIGYFGSYVRNDRGVGSDCDIVVIVSSAEESFEKCTRFYNTEVFPVPCDVFVYTMEEWEKMKQNRFGKRICSEIVWVFRGD